MTDREQADQKSREFFETLWRRGDPWNFESSEFEQVKYDRQVEILSGKHYEQALELGCGAGAFTRRLAKLADRVVAVDISQPLPS